ISFPPNRVGPFPPVWSAEKQQGPLSCHGARCKDLQTLTTDLCALCIVHTAYGINNWAANGRLFSTIGTQCFTFHNYRFISPRFVSFGRMKRYVHWDGGGCRAYKSIDRNPPRARRWSIHIAPPSTTFCVSQDVLFAIAAARRRGGPTPSVDNWLYAHWDVH